MLRKLLAVETTISEAFHYGYQDFSEPVRTEEIEMQSQECTVQPVDANQTLQWEIDRRRRAEQALLESEERHRCLFEAAPLGIAILDQAGNIESVNPYMTQMSGYTLEELQFLGMDALYPDPQLRQEVLGVLSGSGNVQDREVRLKRKDGSSYHAVLNVERVELRGQQALIVNTRDIIKRRRVEQELWKSELKHRTLLEQLLQGLAIFQDSRVVFCNQAYADIFGYSVGELLSFSLQQLISLTHPDDQECVLDV